MTAAFYYLISVGLWTHASWNLFLGSFLSPQFKVSLFSKDMGLFLLGSWLVTPTQDEFTKYLPQDFTGQVCKMKPSHNPSKSGFFLEILRETFISIFLST